MKINLVLVVVGIVMLSSCSSLTDKAKKLKIIKSEGQAVGCVKVGIVESSSFSAGTPEGMFIGNNNSEVNIKNRAAELGDTILMLVDKENIFGSKRKAMVYRCN